MPLLMISITHQPGLIEIIIEDNGVGRMASAKSISNSRESKGIAITRQRIENLNQLQKQKEIEEAYAHYKQAQDKAVAADKQYPNIVQDLQKQYGYSLKKAYSVLFGRNSEQEQRPQKHNV